MHLAIAEVCQEVFYGPGKLASMFPEDFAQALLLKAVALVIMAVCQSHIPVSYVHTSYVSKIECVLAGYEQGHWDKSLKFSAVGYAASYTGILKLMDKLKTSDYHWDKFIQATEKWAQQAALSEQCLFSSHH